MLPPQSLSVTLSLPDWINGQLAEGSVWTTEIDQMEFVIQLAERNVSERSGGPFGAAVFSSDVGRLVAVGVNRVVPMACSVAHAEVMAIMFAQRAAGTYDLGASNLSPLRLVTSAQPCVQCFGVIWWSGIREVIFAATSEDVEELTGFSEGPLPDGWIECLRNRGSLPSVRVVGGVLRERARRPLVEYMKENGTIYSPSGRRAP